MNKLILASIFFLGFQGALFSQRSYKITGGFAQYDGLDSNKYSMLEEYLVQLDSDSKADTVKLFSFEDLSDAEQHFQMIEVNLSSGRNYLLKDVDGFEVDETVKFNARNALRSKYVYLYKTSEGYSVILVWDYIYSDCAQTLRVFKLDEDNVTLEFKGDVSVKEISFSPEGLLISGGLIPCEGLEVYKKMEIVVD